MTLDSLVANFDHFGSGFANFDDDSSKSDQRLFKTHVDNLEASQMIDKSSKVVYVVRDGRDVLVSLYNYEKSLNQEVRDMNFAEFMRSPNPYNVTKPPMKLNRVEYWNHHVQSWLTQDCYATKFVTFDQWKFSFERTLVELGEFLELSPKINSKSMVMKPGQGWLKKILAKIGLSKTTAIQFRGGRSQVWKEHFDSEALDYFSTESEKTYELISERLGIDFEL